MVTRMRWPWVFFALGSAVVGWMLILATSTYSCADVAGAFNCGPTAVDWVRFAAIVAATFFAIAYGLYRAFRKSRP